TVEVGLGGVFVATGAGSLDVGEVSDTGSGQGNVVGDHARAVALSLDTSVAAGGVGSLGASLKLVSVTQGTASWLGVDASGINLSLALGPLSVSVSGGELKLNRFGGTASGKVDWSTFTTAAGHGGGMHLPLVDVKNTLDLHLAGTVAVELAGVFTATAAGSVDLGQLTLAD